MARPDPVRITFLGGLGEIGRNCAALEVDGRILLIDCGVMFPDPDMPGIDLVLPDFEWLRENASRLEGCVLTHGHEDHCGGLAFLLRELSFPIYGSALSLGLARNRIEESGVLDRTELVPVEDGERRQIGPFDVEFMPVTHSVPHGFALALRTPHGVILHSGDFKLDPTPVDGRLTDLARIGSIASEEGVRVLLSDSTNAEEPGHAPSERTVGGGLRQLFARHRSERIIVACFASHIHRIQQIADAALAHGRSIAFLGRSMTQNVALARSLGLLHIPDAAIHDVEKVTELSRGRVCVVSTGSQGEPMSALSLMAVGESKWLEVGRGDVVVLSSHAIPGNEWAVAKVINGLCRRGAEVVHAGLAAVHVSGHGMRGELQTLLAVSRPEYFVPVHGEYRHLVHHARLASEMGVAEENVLLAEDGDVLELSDEGLDFVGEVPAGYLYVDGIVGDVSRGVLRDRRALSQEGVIMVTVIVDAKSGEVVTGPEVVTRGWVHDGDAEGLIEAARQAAMTGIEEVAEMGSMDHETLTRHVRSAIGRFVSQRTRRRPLIVPLVLEV
jgi:ribonuclease J